MAARQFRFAKSKPVVVVMAKEPLPGRVKTRLASDIGSITAVWWFRHQLSRLLRRLCRDPRWKVVLAVAPDLAVGSKLLPGGVMRVPQGDGDLGARMARALRSVGSAPVLVVGADIPGVDSSVIAAALAALEGKDAVIGPATDGGYWLIGFRRGSSSVPSALFRGVRWSSPHALEDTLATMPGMRVGWAPTLRDVDTAADLGVVG